MTLNDGPEPMPLNIAAATIAALAAFDPYMNVRDMRQGIARLQAALTALAATLT